MGNADSRALEVHLTVSDPNSPIDLSRIEELLSAVANEEGVSGQLGIWLCTDSEIADLHLRFMDIPGATDVITFPEDLPETGGYLGDIAVSVDTAAMQALDAGHSTEREVAFLCLHGLLHILGYDDLDARSREAMLARQEELLNGFEREHPGSWRVVSVSQPGDDDQE